MISNMPRGAEPWDSRRPETTMVVEVPISVTVPPRIEAKEIGMR